MDNIISTINHYIWSNALILLCAFTGIYFSIKTGFLQFRYLKTIFQPLVKVDKSSKCISPFQAFSLAISGRVATGHIIGVTTARGIGGPGAAFWMLVMATLVAASAFVEATLGQLYNP